MALDFDFDFDFDKLDKAIGEIMDGLSDDSVDKNGDARKVKSAPASKHEPKNVVMVAATPKVKPEPALNRRRPKVAMTGDRVRNKLSEKPERPTEVPKSSYTTPGRGRFFDMVSPSSDALNQHKPSVSKANEAKLQKPNTQAQVSVHRIAPRHTLQPPRDRHDLTQPVPASPSENTFTTVENKKEPYISPFLPDANEIVKKRPLGSTSQVTNKIARTSGQPYRAQQNSLNHLRDGSNGGASLHGQPASDINLKAKPKKQSKLKDVLIKIVMFAGVILAGGILGVLCFYLFG